MRPLSCVLLCLLLALAGCTKPKATDNDEGVGADTRPAPVKPALEALTVSARDLVVAYTGNEAIADSTYLNKMVEVRLKPWDLSVPEKNGNRYSSWYSDRRVGFPTADDKNIVFVFAAGEAAKLPPRREPEGVSLEHGFGGPLTDNDRQRMKEVDERNASVPDIVIRGLCAGKVKPYTAGGGRDPVIRIDACVIITR